MFLWFLIVPINALNSWRALPRLNQLFMSHRLAYYNHIFLEQTIIISIFLSFFQHIYNFFIEYMCYFFINFVLCFLYEPPQKPFTFYPLPDIVVHRISGG